MLLSRFWYLALAFVLAGAVFLLYVATAVTNRNASSTGNQLLTAASRSVYWYMTDDSRQLATALIPLALDADVAAGLSKATKTEPGTKLDSESKTKVKSKLEAFRNHSAKNGLEFDAIWAIDVHGRVVANANFERGTSSKKYEMGGFSLVADALHGGIRDDAWVRNGQIHRVVARPVEVGVGGVPVGAIVGSKMVDDRYVQAISDKTGAAVAFYAGETRVAKGTPPGFDAAWLSVINTDLQAVEQDENYVDKGRTTPRTLRQNAGFDVRAVFARVPGEAWDLGAGYVVGHRQTVITEPWGFQNLADKADKEAVPLLYVALAAAGLALLGLIFSLLEHTLPLARFRRAVQDLANKKSETDVLKPSTFRGVYKKIASDINDALDKIAARAGVERGPADLDSVLGPLPTSPQMSAFSVPKSSSRSSSNDEPAAAAVPSSGSAASEPQKPRSLPKRSLPTPPSFAATDATDPDPADDDAGNDDEQPRSKDDDEPSDGDNAES